MVICLKATLSRIVCVASEAHKMGGLDSNDLHYTARAYGAWTAYGQSKVYGARAHARTTSYFAIVY